MTGPSPVSHALSRRLFLEGLSRVGGTALLLAGMSALGFGIESAMAAPPELSGGGGKRIIILGAGVAGLSAAYELSNAGYDVVVLEARSFAGGRSQTARRGFRLAELGGQAQTCDFDEGLYINHGPWRLPYHHQSVLYYTRRFGVPLELFVNDNDHAYVHFQKGSGPLANQPVRRQEIAADARGYAAEMLAKCVRQGALDEGFGEGDKELFLAYLQREGYLTAKDFRYLGSEGRGYAVDPGAGVDPGPGKPSTPYRLTDVLHSRAWSTLASVTAFDQQRTMFQPVGGMDRIPAAFVRNLRPGLIRYSARVEKVSQGPDGVQVAYRDASGQGVTVAGDYCLCTIPLSVLRRIDLAVSDRFKAAIASPSYAPVGKIGLQMKRRFWEEDHQIYGGHIYTDDPDIGTISLPSTGWQGRKGVVLGYYQFGASAAKVSAMTPAQRMAFAAAAGQKVMPQYAESVENAFSVAWHRVEFNLGGWAEWSEEGRRVHYPVLSEPDGRIYLAGEHLSYIGGWQAGGIESAWQQIAKIHKRAHAA